MKSLNDFDPVIGVAEELAPGIRRVVAPNPSPMTFRGTNTYIVGEENCAVIDPGPMSAQHLEAILRAVPKGGTIAWIFVTHSHLDHSPLAVSLGKATGAQTFGFGRYDAGRREIMNTLAKSGLAGGGEGIDSDFVPDTLLADGDVIEIEGKALTAIWTPGHISNHLCFGFGDTVFSGDHVMGWASSLVSPPDGDLTAFMQSCRKLARRSDQVYFPGHGAAVHDPAGRLQWLLDHRLSREAQILEALSTSSGTAKALAARIYTDVSPSLLPAASRNVLAHLIALWEDGRIQTEESLSENAEFRLP